MNWGTLRPQILVAIVAGAAVAVIGMYIGMWMGAVEIVTGIIGAIFGFLGGVSLKVLEKE